MDRIEPTAVLDGSELVIFGVAHATVPQDAAGLPTVRQTLGLARGMTRCVVKRLRGFNEDPEIIDAECQVDNDMGSLDISAVGPGPLSLKYEFDLGGVTYEGGSLSLVHQPTFAAAGPATSDPRAAIAAALTPSA